MPTWWFWRHLLAIIAALAAVFLVVEAFRYPLAGGTAVLAVGFAGAGYLLWPKTR